MDDLKPSEVHAAIENSELDLSSRHLYTPPSGLYSLSGLKALNLSSNCLSDLPKAITSLVALCTLDVSYNKLRELPAHLSSLSRLQELIGCYNCIAHIAHEITSLSALTRLLLNDNALAALPHSLSRLCSLRELQLQYNQLTQLHVGLLQCSLEHIDITGNPLPAALVRASEEGPQALMAALTLSGSSTRASAEGCTASKPTADVLFTDSRCVIDVDARAYRQPTLCSPSEKVLINSFADLQVSYDDEDVDDDNAGKCMQASVSMMEVAAASSPLASPGMSLAGISLMNGDAMTIDELSELPPSAAAVMYRSLVTVQQGLSELHQGRPLSRAGLTTPPVPGCSSRASLPSSRGRPSTAGPRSAGSASWLRSSYGTRPGTQGAVRTANLGGISTTLPCRTPSYFGLDCLGAQSHSFTSGGTNRGLSSAAIGMQQYSGNGNSQADEGQSQGTVAGLVDSSSAGDSSAMTHITYPFASGVRSMLRRAGSQAARVQHAKQLDGSVTPGAEQGESQDQMHTPGVTAQLDQLDLVRGLLAGANPALLQALDHALFD